MHNFSKTHSKLGFQPLSIRKSCVLRIVSQFLYSRNKGVILSEILDISGGDVQKIALLVFIFTSGGMKRYNLNMGLGARIKELRIMNALTQAELAEKVGVNTSAVSLWENDVNEPKASYLARLALVFSVSADYLLGIEDEAGSRLM